MRGRGRRCWVVNFVGVEAVEVVFRGAVEKEWSSRSCHSC